MSGDLIREADEHHYVAECTNSDCAGCECASCGEAWPCEVRRLRDALEAERNAAKQARNLCDHRHAGISTYADTLLTELSETKAALAEANATIAALREREETAGHIAESERFRAIEATRELVEAREAIERVRAVIESPYHGTYWGRVQVPQEDIRRAIEGPAT